MTIMLRAVVLATLFFVIPRTSPGQALSVLHIKVVLLDANQKVTPVPHHALLVSDNPATAAPRLIVTAVDGTADVRLRPGNYTVESDRPVAFQGKAYQWTQMVDIVAGRDDVLQLTADNAEVEPVASATTTGAAPLEADPAFLLPQWQDSVVALWTADTHASGFVVDAKGLIATNQRVIGTATSVEVQLTTPSRWRQSSSRPILCGMSPSSGSIRRSSPQCGPSRWDACKRRSRPSWTGRKSSQSERRSVSRRA